MKEQDYISLIQRNLQGSLSPAEFQQLNVATAQDPTLAKLRLELEDAWDMAGSESTIVTPPETKLLQSKIQKGSTNTSAQKAPVKKPVKIFSIYKAISSIAAIGVIAFAATWLMRDQVHTYDQPGVYTLADQSEVTLREGSTLTVAAFDDNSRSVSLMGEAFFEIAKDQSRTFEITTTNTIVKVLGTAFLIKENKDETYVVLKTGKLETLDLRSQKAEILTQGMQAYHNREGQIVLSSGVSNLSGWKDGYYRYSNVTIGTVIKDLSLIFSTEIIISEDEISNCSFSGNLAGDTLEILLSRIAKTQGINAKFDGKKWILSGGQCK